MFFEPQNPPQANRSELLKVLDANRSGSSQSLPGPGRRAYAIRPHIVPHRQYILPSWATSPLRCICCGILTLDWVSCTPSQMSCICKSCHPRIFSSSSSSRDSLLYPLPF